MSATDGPVRVVFAGTPDVAVPALDALVAAPGLEVVAVIANPARPKGRRGSPIDPPVAVRARELGLPVLQPERPVEVRDRLAELTVDIGAVVAYGALLPPALLAVPRAGWVNLHFSLLPRWRGAAPVQHAIRAGDTVTGVTVFRLDAGMDTGPVLRQATVPIPPDAETGGLLGLLAQVGAPVLVDGVRAAVAGEPGRAQDADGVTLAPRLRPDDGLVPWTADAVEVARTIRAVTPRPGARTVARGGTLKVAGAAASGTDAPLGASPGEVLGTDDTAILVACGTGAVRIDRVQPAGRRWVAAADAVRGRLLAIGDVLDETVAGAAGAGG